MKKSLTLFTIALIVGACNSRVTPVDHKDSTECAVFEGFPLAHGTDFETEPIFIPLSLVPVYSQGDTVLIDSNNVVQGMPLYASDERRGRWVDPKLTRLMLHARITPNKYLLTK